MDCNFRSDNEAPVAQPVLEALVAANEGTAHGYAEDAWSERLDAAYSELLGAPARVLPISTGTAANSIALACVTPPWGSVVCHRGAHILTDEGGAPEFYGHGLRLVPVDGVNGKLHPDAVRAALRATAGHGVHSYEAAAISLTNATECGTVYTPDEVGALGALARDKGLALHMDGARFANAVAALGCAPGTLTAEVGVSLLSFGASKNGCMAAEALVFLGHHELYEHAERLRKRAGHLLSKMRYVSAQLLAYIHNDLWLDLARHANARAAEFAAAVQAQADAALEYPVEANEVFVRWTPEGFDALRAAGMQFHMWPGRDDLARFVFSCVHREEEVARLAEALEAA